MSRRSTSLLKSALSALSTLRIDRLLASRARGDGTIIMLHQVDPAPPGPFEPNRILRITPDFLDQTIRQVLEAGYVVLSLDEVAARLAAPRDADARPFVCFTLDDGYRDNLQHALPVFRRYGVPFAVYVPTDYVDGHGELWWLALEQALARLDHVDVSPEGGPGAFNLASSMCKDKAFHAIYWWLRGIDETVARRIVCDLCATAGIDAKAICPSLVMNWDELRTLATDPLVTIGAHTRRHYALARLGANAVRVEMTESITRLERELGRKIRHFSYPFGDESAAGHREFDIARSLGLATAVTTRKGMIRADSDAFALPRLSLNGDYQDASFVRVLMSGVPFLLNDMAQRLSPARLWRSRRAAS